MALAKNASALIAFYASRQSAFQRVERLRHTLILYLFSR